MLIHTHLFLVHGDMIPNITPILDPSFRPNEVFLLSSPETDEQAELLEQILKQANVGVYRWHIDDLWNIEHIRERVLDFITSRTHGDIALNATGGTRPMSLAAYEMFSQADKPIYYVQPQSDHVVWLHPRSWGSFDLADKIKFPAYFTAHGMRLAGCAKQGIPGHLRTLTDILVRDVNQFAQPLAILNRLASSSDTTLATPPLEKGYRDVPDLSRLISLFESHHLLKTTSARRIQFPSEEARFYANGGWLEEHIYGVLFNLRSKMPTIQDLARNLKVEWDIKGSPVCNEIDVAFLADNRLYLIECKTKNFEKTKKADPSSSEVLYKLDTLRDYMGGTGARALLVSYRSLPETARLRAREFGIELYEQSDIQGMETKLRKWITQENKS
jgi:hypothetical protein